MILLKKPFENIVVSSIFFFFPTMFSTLLKKKFNFSFTFSLSSTNSYNLDQSEILLFDKKLNGPI